MKIDFVQYFMFFEIDEKANKLALISAISIWAKLKVLHWSNDLVQSIPIFSIQIN